jgi:large subunit ribosomal protein L15
MKDILGLHSLNSPRGARKTRKRVGRGPGSGLGKTAGRGHKGQLARTGGKVKRWSEGGQMPIQRRLPKRGFRNKWRVTYEIVNVGVFSRYPHLEEFTPEVFFKLGLTRKKEGPVCVLGEGTLDKKVTVSAQRFSRSAREKIEAHGGKAEVL